ncbi:hypothetical protein BGW41_005532 [Actinomortierella wolfii]|nr:hypothetical protein BGW41_005532 [Actinomortierella wolfii]
MSLHGILLLEVQSSNPSINILDCIGRGAYGSVYRARLNSQAVAIKHIHLMPTDMAAKKAINEEIRVLKCLANRRAVKFYDATYFKDQLIVVMELAQGGNLCSAIERHKLDWPTKYRIAREIAEGLAYIHAQGIIHRDLKSSNVLLTCDSEARLCDFGLATVKMNSSLMTTDGHAARARSIRWMAPELLVKRPRYSTKSDMYALGMVMWEMAAKSTVPFKEQVEDIAVIKLISEGKRENLPEDTLPSYRAWVERCWRQDPAGRPEAYDMTNIHCNDDMASEKLSSVRAERGEASVETTRTAARLNIAFESESKCAKSPKAIGMVPMEKGNNRGSWGSIPGFKGDSTQQTDISLLLTHASFNDVETQITLANMYRVGDGVEQTKSRVGGGTEQIRSRVGDRVEQIKSNSGDGVEKSTKMFRQYNQAAKQEHVQGQVGVVTLYDCGKGVKQELKKAVAWYRKGADQGSSFAQYMLGRMYQVGLGVVQDDVMAESWYRRAAEQGHVDSQFNLGVMLEKGRSADGGYVEAASWFLKAAQEGHTKAQVCLARLFEDGRGVDQDIAKAAYWYRRAATQGSDDAQIRFTRMYRNERGIGQNEAEALAWYHAAIQQAHADAQGNIRMMRKRRGCVKTRNTTTMPLYHSPATQGNLG